LAQGSFLSSETECKECTVQYNLNPIWIGNTFSDQFYMKLKIFLNGKFQKYNKK
jgi:hypothetical protein